MIAAGLGPHTKMLCFVVNDKYMQMALSYVGPSVSLVISLATSLGKACMMLIQVSVHFAEIAMMVEDKERLSPTLYI
jgi:hypothetical protein